MRHENDFRRAIRNGETVIGARTSTFSPAFVEIYGAIGLDFVWIDYEHGGPSPADSFRLADLTRAAEVADVQLLARVPLEADTIRKVLDAGVRNVLVPRIDTAEEVTRAVEASRFVYEDRPGARGFAGGRSSDYGNAMDYVRREDESVCLGVMVETGPAVRNLEDILSVPELGFAFLGPSDLSVQLGHPGDPDHPDVREAIRRVETACADAGIPLGGIGHGADAAGELLDQGYQILRLGGDFEAARETLERRLQRLPTGPDE